MDNEIIITSDDGKTEQVSLITELDSPEGNHYIIYSRDNDGLDDITVYTSKVIEKNGKKILEDVTEEELEEVVTFLDQLEEE